MGVAGGADAWWWTGVGCWHYSHDRSSVSLRVWARHALCSYTQTLAGAPQPGGERSCMMIPDTIRFSWSDDVYSEWESNLSTPGRVLMGQGCFPASAYIAGRAGEGRVGLGQIAKCI